MVGYWPLDEDSGGAVRDFSGRGNEGSLYSGNASKGSSGILGGTSYDFSGTSDYVDVAYSGGVLSDFTVALWVFNSDWSSSNREGALSTGENRSNKPLNWDKDGSREFAHYRGDAAGQVMNVGGVSDGWHHAAVTQSRKGSSTVDLKLFFDGRQVDSTSGDYEDMDLSKRLYFGQGGFDSNYWNGKICEIRIYNRELTPDELQYIYTASQRGRQVSSRKSS